MAHSTAVQTTGKTAQSGARGTCKRTRTTNQNSTPLHSASTVTVARYPRADSGVKCQSATIIQYKTTAWVANPYQNPTRNAPRGSSSRTA